MKLWILLIIFGRFNWNCGRFGLVSGQSPAWACFSGAREGPSAHFGPDLLLVNWPCLVRAENRQPLWAKTGHRKVSKK